MSPGFKEVLFQPISATADGLPSSTDQCVVLLFSSLKSKKTSVWGFAHKYLVTTAPFISSGLLISYAVFCLKKKKRHTLVNTKLCRTNSAKYDTIYALV